ncbi:MAG: DUF1559 domain-containing protein [Planctomycetota bacterium]
MSNLPPQQPSPYGIQPDQGQPRQSKSNSMLILVGVLLAIVLVCGGVLAGLLLPAVSAARKAAQRMSRSNDLKLIGLAIHNYHSAYKQLPFTIVTNSNGEEIGGWRVGVSPFAEGQQQWDNYMSNNQSRDIIASDPPASFQGMEAAPGDTNIFALVGPNSAFPPTPNTKVRFSSIVDGLANTAIAIELPNRSTNWASNDNMTADEAYAALQQLEGGDVGHLLMADGAVIAVVPDIDQQLFNSLITINGGEVIEEMVGM